MSDPNLERAAALDTATLSDALDRFGVVGQCWRIQGRDPGFSMTGRAYTMLCGPAATPPGTVGDYIDDVQSGVSLFWRRAPSKTAAAAQHVSLAGPPGRGAIRSSGSAAGGI